MNNETISWILNIFSNLLWVCIFIPQLYTNYRLKNSDAISLSLLILLMFGEIYAITSSYYKNLHIIVLLTGVYHLFFETSILIQSIYYRYINKDESENIPLLNGYIHKSFNKYELLLIYLLTMIYSICIVFGFLYKDLIGDILAWGATCIFIISRIPQIILNYKRNSTEGLAMGSFIILMISSIAYLISIILVNDILDIIQWVIGILVSLLIFDSIIVYQFITYN